MTGMGSERCWLAITRSLVLVVAMYLWTSIAKTAVEVTMSRPTVEATNMASESRADLGWPTRALLGAAQRTTATERPRIKSAEYCWAPDPVYGVWRTPEGEYVIHKNAPGWRPSNVDDVFPQARIIQSMKNGVYRGFEFVRVRPGSLYDKLGIEKGDILRRVNGYEINSPDNALEVYQKLRGCNRVEVEFERQGEIVRKTYRVEQ